MPPGGRKPQAARGCAWAQEAAQGASVHARRLVSFTRTKNCSTSNLVRTTSGAPTAAGPEMNAMSLLPKSI
jgi:hypothetical protein